MKSHSTRAAMNDLDTLARAYLRAADGDAGLALRRAVEDVARLTSVGYARGRLPGAEPPPQGEYDGAPEQQPAGQEDDGL